MKFENFEKILNAIELTLEKNSKRSEILSELYESFVVTEPDLVSDVIKLLESEFADEGEWISYFIYDLSFGKDYQDGCITDHDKNISLKTIRELYDFLLKNKNKNENENL